jgi:phage gpG-like protein
MELQYNILGDVQLRRWFNRLAEDVSDASEPLKEVTADFWEMEQRQFDSEGGASGGWAALSTRTATITGQMGRGALGAEHQSYAAWKARHYPGKKILEREGYLKGSLTNSGIGAAWTINEPEKLRVTVGTKLGYAAYHQTGTPNMPRRRPIDLTEKDKKRWTQIFHRWLIARSKQHYSVADMQKEAGVEFKGAVT